MGLDFRLKSHLIERCLLLLGNDDLGSENARLPRQIGSCCAWRWMTRAGPARKSASNERKAKERKGPPKFEERMGPPKFEGGLMSIQLPNMTGSRELALVSPPVY